VIYRQKTKQKKKQCPFSNSNFQIYTTQNAFFFHSTTLLKPIHTHNEDGSLKKASTKIPSIFVPFGNYKEGANGLHFIFFFA
jgi:hypothetical protein